MRLTLLVPQWRKVTFLVVASHTSVPFLRSKVLRVITRMRLPVLESWLEPSRSLFVRSRLTPESMVA